MQFRWRGNPISGHAEWRERIAAKDDKPGRSAPTLAAAWAGPAELLSALSKNEELADLEIETVDVEVQTAFDEWPGGKRNHDLVAVGRSSGGRVVVCVEAKAGETFGQTVGDYSDAAIARRNAGESTNAPERLDGLLRDWIPSLFPESDEVRRLRYQLFTAVAGTVAEAEKRGATHAVFMVHEFLTDDRTAENVGDLTEFAALVLGQKHLPDDSELPWCIEVHTRAGGDLKLYLARATTDLLPRAVRP